MFTSFRSLLAVGGLLLVMAGLRALSIPTSSSPSSCPFAAGSATDQLARALGVEVTRLTQAAGDRRQQAGRLRIHRRGGSEEGGAGWLYGVHHDQHDARRQRASVQEDSVRPGQGLPAGHRPRQGRADHDRQPEHCPRSRSPSSSRSPKRSRARSASAAAARRRAWRARCSSKWRGIELLHVPYKSNPLAINDLLGGQINMMITDMATGLPQVKGGKVRALGVSHRQALAA